MFARLTQKYTGVLSLTQARPLLKERGLLLVLAVFPLLHPPTAGAGHHPRSSSFASQPEHSGRMATPDRFPYSIKVGPPVRVPSKIRTRPTRIILFFPAFFFAQFSHARSTTHTHTPTVLKRKSVAHTHTCSNFSSNFVPSKKIPLFSFQKRRKTTFPASLNAYPAGTVTGNSQTDYCVSLGEPFGVTKKPNREISPFANSFFFHTRTAAAAAAS